MKKGIFMLGALLALLIALSGTAMASCSLDSYADCDSSMAGKYYCTSDSSCNYSIYKCNASALVFEGVDGRWGPATFPHYFDQDDDYHADESWAGQIWGYDACGLVAADDCVDSGTVNGVAAGQIHPGVTEVCNDGVDNDCDHLTDCEEAGTCNGQVNKAGYTCCNGSTSACPTLQLPLCDQVTCSWPGNTCIFAHKTTGNPVAKNEVNTLSVTRDGQGNVISSSYSSAIGGGDLIEPSAWEKIFTNGGNTKRGMIETKYELDDKTGGTTTRKYYYRADSGGGMQEQGYFDGSTCTSLINNPNDIGGWLNQSMTHATSYREYSDQGITNQCVERQYEAFKCPPLI